MRQNPTPAERLLWQAFRRKAFAGLKIRRQVPFWYYILDFYIPALRIAIEVDGESHVDAAADVARDAWFLAQGIRTVRYWNNAVTANLEGVLLSLLAEFFPAAPPPPPNPLPQGEGVFASPLPLREGPGEG